MTLSLLFLFNILRLLLQPVYKYIINNYRFTAILKTTIPLWFFFQILPLNLIIMVATSVSMSIFQRMLVISIFTNFYILFYIPVTVFSSVGNIYMKMKLKVEGGRGTTCRLGLEYSGEH